MKPIYGPDTGTTFRIYLILEVADAYVRTDPRMDPYGTQNNNNSNNINNFGNDNNDNDNNYNKDY